LELARRFQRGNQFFMCRIEVFGIDVLYIEVFGIEVFGMS
jgi:hypothetical protein